MPCLSIQIDPIDDAYDDGLYGNLRVFEERARGVSFLHHEHLLANADADHVEYDDLSALLLIVEIEPTNEEKLFLSEMLVAVRRHHVTDDASEIQAALPGKSLLSVDVHPIHLPDNARVHSCERIIECQRGLTRRDEIDDLARSDTNAINGDERLAGVRATRRDGLNPLKGDGGQRVLLDLDTTRPMTRAICTRET